MAYWLLKSEPDVFSIADLKKARRTAWEGVRNYQARNFLRAMKRGDEALVYHSSTSKPSIVGRARVALEAYPDPLQFDPKSEYYDPKSRPEDPRWSRVDVEFVEAFPKPLTIDEARREKALRTMALFKFGRLSVQPVAPSEWRTILRLCRSHGLMFGPGEISPRKTRKSSSY